MTEFLIKLIKNKKEKSEQRSAYAELSAFTGIICNVILCAVKFVIGAVTGSLSVTADAVNNLSDSASNIVTLTGTRLSDKPDDEEHPFGHGRIEYISALIVAISIFVVSLELAKSSVEKIIHPENIKFSVAYIAVLMVTVLVKLWMAFFNHKLYKITDNINLKAVKQDSLNDCIVTFASVFSLVLSHIFGFKTADGIIGLGVCAFIFYSGVGILKQVVSPLLGEAQPQELTEKIERIILENGIVIGVHDIVIHSYGANKMLASADAVVDASAYIFTIHDVIDAAEKKIFSELNIEMCIHMDPVDKNDMLTRKYKLIVQGIITEYNSDFSFHDFRITENNGIKAVNFDLTVPFEYTSESEKIKKDINVRFTRLCPEIQLEFNVEHP